MVETREQPYKDEKKDFKIRIRKRWFVLLGALFFVIPISCWALVKYVVEPVFEKQEIYLGAPGVTYDIKLTEVVLEKSPHYVIGLDLVLELNNGRVTQELRIKEPRIIEMIYDIIAEESPETVVTVAGRHKLKRNLINRLNEEVKSGKIVQIYMTRFAMAKEPVTL